MWRRRLRRHGTLPGQRRSLFRDSVTRCSCYHYKCSCDYCDDGDCESDDHHDDDAEEEQEGEEEED